MAVTANPYNVCVCTLYVTADGANCQYDLSDFTLFDDGIAYEVATFAMRWFWLPEGRFGVAPGVLRTYVVYTGGTTLLPTYKKL